MRPPLYDSPTTRGLFDPVTGVYWASDCFAAPVARPTVFAAELDADEWAGGFLTFQQWNSPWFEMLDASRYAAAVDRFTALDPRAIASCHAPVLDGANVSRAFSLLRDVIHAPYTPMPNQAVLDSMLTAAATA